jgi:hypothetical protein
MKLPHDLVATFTCDDSRCAHLERLRRGIIAVKTVDARRELVWLR